VFADNNPIVKYDVNGEGTNGDVTSGENQPQALSANDYSHESETPLHNKNIVFIDKDKGTYLGSYCNDANTESEVRSISAQDFGDFSDNGFKAITVHPNTLLSIDSSALVTIDSEKIATDLKSMTSHNKGEDKIDKENNMVIVFDNVKNIITSIVINNPENTNGTAKFGDDVEGKVSHK